MLLKSRPQSMRGVRTCRRHRTSLNNLQLLGKWTLNDWPIKTVPPLLQGESGPFSAPFTQLITNRFSNRYDHLYFEGRKIEEHRTGITTGRSWTYRYPYQLLTVYRQPTVARGTVWFLNIMEPRFCFQPTLESHTWKYSFYMIYCLAYHDRTRKLHLLLGYQLKMITCHCELSKYRFSVTCEPHSM
jgi:hypothetical protein